MRSTKPHKRSHIANLRNTTFLSGIEICGIGRVESFTLSHSPLSPLFSAGSRGAAERPGLWLRGRLPPTWGSRLDAGRRHVARRLQIRLQEREHPSVFPIPSQGRGLQQHGRGTLQPRDHHLLSRGRSVQVDLKGEKCESLEVCSVKS